MVKHNDIITCPKCGYKSVIFDPTGEIRGSVSVRCDGCGVGWFPDYPEWLWRQLAREEIWKHYQETIELLPGEHPYLSLWYRDDEGEAQYTWIMELQSARKPVENELDDFSLWSS